MISLLPFTPYPKVKLELNKDIIDPKVISGAEIVQITWSSLLGKDNEELIRIELLCHPKFAIHIEKTKKDFKKSYDNFNKYPKMNKIDWE